MRAGYNDSVELYRTTIRRVPEVILAKFFKFEDAEFLQTEVKVYKLPEIDFDEPEGSPDPASSSVSEDDATTE